MVGVHGDGGRKTVVGTGVGDDLLDQVAGYRVDDVEGRHAAAAVVAVAEDHHPGVIGAVRSDDDGLAERIAHVRVAGLGKFPEHPVGEFGFRGDRFGVRHVQAEIALAAFSQSAHEQRVRCRAAKNARPLFHGGGEVDVKTVGVGRVGQELEVAEDQVRHVGEDLHARVGIEGVQHAVVAAGVDHVIQKHRRGVHDVAQFLRAVAVAADRLAPQVFHFVFMIRAEEVFLSLRQVFFPERLALASVSSKVAIRRWSHVLVCSCWAADHFGALVRTSPVTALTG